MQPWMYNWSNLHADDDNDLWCPAQTKFKEERKPNENKENTVSKGLGSKNARG